jgi:hypothetical protein
LCKSYYGFVCKFTKSKIFGDPQRREKGPTKVSLKETMPEIKTKPFAKKAQKEHDSGSVIKRKVSESKGKSVHSPNAGKKRKLDQFEHVPTLVSSTFNPLEEVDFPRGGSTLTPLEKKQAEQEGIRDALFEVYFLLEFC